MRHESIEFGGSVIGAELHRLPAAAHSIVIVNAVPIIRLGLASAIADTSSLASYSIFAFRTFVEAAAKVSEANAGDVIILDINAWFMLTGPGNSCVLQRIKARGASLGVIAPMKQVNITRVSGVSTRETNLGG